MVLRARLGSLAREWSEKSRTPIAILGVVVLLFFSPALLQTQKVIWSHSPLGSDISYRHWPDLIGYAASLREGRIALWDPMTALGRPLAGDPGVLFMYPFTLLFLLFPPALAFNVYDAIHIFLAGLFTYLLLRVGYQVSRPSALIGGLAFAFTPKLISHMATGHVGVIAGLAWAPAVLLGLKLAFDGSLLAAALAGLAMAMQMPTHVQEPYYTALIGSVLWLWNLVPAVWRGWRGDTSAWKRVRRLIVVYAVWLVSFALFAAVVLAPLVELLPYNSRANLTLADANAYALLPPLLLTLFAPGYFQLSEWVVFLGVLPPLLGALGLIASRPAEKWLLALLIGFALVYALGTATPLFGSAFAVIPGFRLLRVPTRMWFFAALAVAILAGLGTNALTQPEIRQGMWQRRRLLARGVGVYFAGGAAGLIGYWVVFHRWHWLLMLQLFTAVLMVALFAAWLNGTVNGYVLQWILIPVVLLDLLPVAANFIDLVEPRSTFMQSTSEFDFVSGRPGLFRVYSPLGTLPFALAAERHVEILEGLLAFQIGHAVETIREATGCTKPGYATSVPVCLDDIKAPSGVPDARRLGELNVRYVITPQQLAGPNFKLVFAHTEYVYEDLLWQPRARVSPDGVAEILNRRAGEYSLSVSLPQFGVLIVSETWLPGWQATVDGQPRAVEKVEGALIGVPLEAGRHEVSIVYDPVGWRIGWITSAASLGALGVWAGIRLWRSWHVREIGGASSPAVP